MSAAAPGAARPDFHVPPATAAAQRLASAPDHSVWVSANAGAGKTKVLVDRVIRLLLSGTPPNRILCLTFTKAAAATMTIRVFDTLGAWVTLDDPALADTLAKLTGEPPKPALLGAARRLFARAVETPGGLKIETIHAFCERILHTVPFEAGVPPRFAVLDDAKAAELTALARGRVLTAAVADEEGRLGRAYATVGLSVSGQALTELLDAAVAHDALPADEAALARETARLRAALGLAPDETPDAVRRAMAEGGIPPAEWPALAAAFRATGSKADAGQADALDRAAAASDIAARLEAYRGIFVKKTDGMPRDRIVTKAGGEALAARLGAEAERLVGQGDRLRAAETVERTDAVFALAGAVRARVAADKRRLGALDFGDLIGRTLRLLEQGSAAWVLYKLDRGVDHVLVDEAQDTNPEQWRILRLLTAEFTAGAGRPAARPRTLFAVGDPKQSIYSFQGADPRWFEDSRRYWSVRVKQAGGRFADVRLDLSFRSAPAILRAVDATFAVPAHHKGLSFAETELRTVHGSARPAAPGHVEIWPTVLRTEAAGEDDAWTIPVDQPDSKAPAVQVAERVAATIRRWVTAGDETGRVWRAGEILILSRKRGPAFFAAIRALKGAGVRVAGADRFDIADHIAVNDLLAAATAGLLPRNDLALAAALKSPLVELDDDDLVRIAADRGDADSLADALARAAAEGDPAAERGAAALEGWRALARAHGPFGFYATLLGPGGGRRRLVARLGGEAADAIDAFLCEAEAAEGGPDTPSLTAFLARFETAEHTIKRDLDAVGDEVKVMTVHGAKGLEAPAVFVLDGCEVGGRDAPFLLLPAPDGGAPVAAWAGARATDSATLARAREAAAAARLEEHNRLLYVALTRAKDRLVVAPFATRAEPPEAWCAMVRRGFAEAAIALASVEHPEGPAAIWADGDPEAAAPPPAPAPVPDEPEPAWLRRPAPADDAPPRPVSPSRALASGPAAPVVPSRAAARRHGILVHALVDQLAACPAGERRAAAERLVAVRQPRLGAAGAAAIVADALAVLDAPRLAPLFGPGSRGEVALAGSVPVPGGGTMAVSGQADRLLVTPDAVWVADLKTGAPPPDGAAPLAHLAQLALYRAVLATVHPDRPVRALLVWTTGPAVTEPSAEELDRALAAAWEAGAPLA